MLRTAVSIAICLISCTVGSAQHSAKSFDVLSPGKRHQLTFQVDTEGRLSYSVSYLTDDVVQKSRLGLVLETKGKLDKDLLLDGKPLHTRRRGKIVSRLAERREVEYEYIEWQVSFTQKNTGLRLRIIFKLFDEAIAFRYELPQQRSSDFVIKRDLTEVRLPPTSVAFTEYGHEGKYRPKAIGQIRRGCELPLLVRNDKRGCYHAILQADYAGYARRFIYSLNTKGVLAFSLASKVKNARRLPWHVIASATSAAELVQENFVRDAIINEHRREPQWIVPGKVIRVLDLTTQGGREAVDFAAENGLQYIEFDAHWYGAERDPNSDATTPRRGLDVAEVCKYAKSKDIGVILYVNKVHLRLQASQIFPKYQRWGVRGLKFGFVDGRTQKGIAEVHQWTKLAYQHRMIVDIHDNYRPTGLSQRFPNLLTQEGIRGNEHMPTAGHNTTLPFTRFIAGAGDYTFCYQIGRVKTTNGHQLAMTVVCFSPLQFVYWYGRPKSYKKSLGKEWFRIVPTTWDDTRVVSGEVGQYAVVARRSGSDWYLGAITNEKKRSVPLPLSFLNEKASYKATIFRDKPGVELQIQRQLAVTSTTKLTESLLPSGGVAIVIRKDK